MNDIEQSELELLKNYTKDKRLDAEYLAERSKNEPLITAQDITTYEDFEHMLDRTFNRIIKFTDNGGQTWRYGRVSPYVGMSQHVYNRELLPHLNVHCSIPIRKKDFVGSNNTRYLIIRPVTEEEALPLRFSYE